MMSFSDLGKHLYLLLLNYVHLSSFNFLPTQKRHAPDHNPKY